MTDSKLKRYIVKLNSHHDNAAQLFEDVLNQNQIKYESLSFIKRFIIEATPENITEVKKLSYVLLVYESMEIPNSICFPKHPEMVVSKRSSKREFLNYGVNQINAPHLWKQGITGKGINVAVVDSGIVPHKYLQLAGQVSFVPGEAPDLAISPDGVAHGTHVAGIIAARGHEDGVVGIAYDCNLYNVKVLGINVPGEFAYLLQGLNWCGLNKMNVINASLGFRNGLPAAELQELTEIIDALVASGTIVVCATGNQDLNKVEPPAYVQHAIAVGCVDRNDIRAPFSNYGERIDYVAPGVDIVSTGPQNGTAILSGTSMSSPHVAGLVTLLLSQDIKEGKPLKGIDEIQSTLNATVVDLGSPGYDLIYGFGRIQAK